MTKTAHLAGGSPLRGSTLSRRVGTVGSDTPGSPTPVSKVSELARRYGITAGAGFSSHFPLPGIRGSGECKVCFRVATLSLLLRFLWCFDTRVLRWSGPGLKVSAVRATNAGTTYRSYGFYSCSRHASPVIHRSALRSKRLDTWQVSR